MATRSTPKLPENARKASGSVVRPTKGEKNIVTKGTGSPAPSGKTSSNVSVAIKSVTNAGNSLLKRLETLRDNSTSQQTKYGIASAIVTTRRFMQNVASYASSGDAKSISSGLSGVQNAVNSALSYGNSTIAFRQELTSLTSACQSLIKSMGKADDKANAPIRHSESGTYLEHASDVVRDFAFIYGDIPIDDIADIM